MKDFLNGRKRRPTHPGEALREDIMPGAGINQAQLAKALGVSRLTISEIVRERRESRHRHSPGEVFRYQPRLVAWSSKGRGPMGRHASEPQNLRSY